MIVAVFDPATLVKDTFTVPQSSYAGSMVVWNESNISLTLTFQTGDSAYIPAWGARKFYGSYGGSIITWEQQAQLASNQPPLSQVIVEVYAQGENTPDIFPQSLASRQNNVGNASTVTTAASSIQNDGNVAGTSVIESTVSGDIPSCVTFSNDGILSIGNATHPGSVSFDNGGITSNGAGTLTAVDLTAGTLTATNTAGGIITGSTLTLTGALSTDAGKFISDGAGGLTALSIALQHGSISRIAKAGPFTVTTVLTAFNHGLTATPDFVIAMIDSASALGHSVYIDFGSFTTTQVKLKADSSVTVYILSIRF